MAQLRGVIGASTAVLIGVVLIPDAHGEATAPQATVRVHVEPSAAEEWQRSAMAITLARHIATDKRWAVIDKDTAEVTFRAVLAPEGLRYSLDIRSVDGVATAARGTIAVSGNTRVGFRNDVLNALSPLLHPGGAIAELARNPIARPPGEVAVDGSAGQVHRNGAVAMLLVVALLFVVPLGIGAVLLGPERRGRLLGLRSLRATFIMWGALAVAAVVIAADLLPAARWPIYIPAGIAWGWFVAAFAQMTFPPFRGLERVEHRDVFRLVAAWCALAIQRLATGTLLYGPFALVMWWTCAALGVPTHVTIGIVAPLWGLTVRLWFLCLVDTLALVLDGELVTGATDANNPWQVAVRGYFVGYLRRSGAEFPGELLDRVLFLPGRGDGIHLYGGGLTHSRVVIGVDLLEHALAPYDRPHDYAPEREHKLLWAEWTSGLVIPIDAESPVATKDDRRPRHELEGGEVDDQPLGEPRTLAGYVEPSAIDERHDFRPAEDPTWLDWDPGEEHDGTDPNDKDFLFGALVRELGLIERRDDHMLTVALVFTSWLSRRPAKLSKAWQWLVKPYRLIVARYPAMLADAYAALNHARNHLVQYLAWRLWQRENQLTARAYPPELERQSERIFRALTKDTVTGVAEDLDRRRLVWMSAFTQRPLRSRRAIIGRRVALAGVAVAVAAALALGVKRAIDYHPTYEKRIEQQRTERATHGDKDRKQTPAP